MYVRTTEKIWSEIDTRIGKMFQARAEHANNIASHGATAEEWNELLLRSVVSVEDEKHIAQLPDYFFVETKSFYVNTQHELWPVTLNTPMRLPGQWDRYDKRPKAKYNVERINEILEKRKVARQKVEDEKQAFVKKVKDLWNQATSVNELIKLWPPIVDLLPQDVIDRVNAKPTRTKREKPEADVSELNVHMLKARVAA